MQGRVSRVARNRFERWIREMHRFISMTHARNNKIESDLLSAEKQTRDLGVFLCKRSGRQWVYIYHHNNDSHRRHHHHKPSRRRCQQKYVSNAACRSSPILLLLLQLLLPRRWWWWQILLLILLLLLTTAVITVYALCMRHACRIEFSSACVLVSFKPDARDAGRCSGFNGSVQLLKFVEKRRSLLHRRRRRIVGSVWFNYPLFVSDPSWIDAGDLNSMMMMMVLMATTTLLLSRQKGTNLHLAAAAAAQ